MIQIVFKPEKAPVVKGEGLYQAVFNCEDLGLRVRAKNAREAERKIMVVFRHELTDKTINFRPEDFPAYDKEENDEKETKGDYTNNSRSENPVCPGIFKTS